MVPGFGSCCQFTIRSTDQIATRNCTYIQNPEYPNKYESTTQFNWNVGNIGDDICFVRVDFVHVELSTDVLQTTTRGTPMRAGNCMDILQLT